MKTSEFLKEPNVIPRHESAGTRVSRDIFHPAENEYEPRHPKDDTSHELDEDTRPSERSSS